MIDVIDTAEVDLDSVDVDGAIPSVRTICTLHLHGDFQHTCEEYMGINRPDGSYSNKFVFELHEDVARELHKQLGRVLS